MAGSRPTESTAVQARLAVKQPTCESHIVLVYIQQETLETEQNISTIRFKCVASPRDLLVEPSSSETSQ